MSEYFTASATLTADREGVERGESQSQPSVSELRRTMTSIGQEVGRLWTRLWQAARGGAERLAEEGSVLPRTAVGQSPLEKAARGVWGSTGPSSRLPDPVRWLPATGHALPSSQAEPSLRDDLESLLGALVGALKELDYEPARTRAMDSGKLVFVASRDAESVWIDLSPGEAGQVKIGFDLSGFEGATCAAERDSLLEAFARRSRGWRVKLEERDPHWDPAGGALTQELATILDEPETDDGTVPEHSQGAGRQTPRKAQREQQ